MGSRLKTHIDALDSPGGRARTSGHTLSRGLLVRSLDNNAVRFQLVLPRLPGYDFFVLCGHSILISNPVPLHLSHSGSSMLSP